MYNCIICVCNMIASTVAYLQWSLFNSVHKIKHFPMDDTPNALTLQYMSVYIGWNALMKYLYFVYNCKSKSELNEKCSIDWAFNRVEKKLKN